MVIIGFDPSPCLASSRLCRMSKLCPHVLIILVSQIPDDLFSAHIHRPQATIHTFSVRYLIHLLIQMASR